MDVRFSYAAFFLAMAIAFGPAIAVAQMTTPPQPRPDNGTIPGSTSRMGRTGPTKSKPEEIDKAFVSKAAQDSMAAVNLAGLAEKKGSIHPVRRFGETIVKDDTEASRKLTKAATETNIAMPQSPTQQQKTQYDSLSKLSGSQFDHAYTQASIQSLGRDIKLYEHEAKNGNRSQMKAYAKDALPMLESQLQHAKGIEKHLQ